MKSRSRDIGCYNDHISLKFDRHFDIPVTEVPVKCQSDWKSLNPNLAASTLHKSLWEDVRPLVNRGQDCPWTFQCNCHKQSYRLIQLWDGSLISSNTSYSGNILLHDDVMTWKHFTHYALCEISTVTGEFPSQSASNVVLLCFISLNNLLNKLLGPLCLIVTIVMWRHYNGPACPVYVYIGI